MCVCVCVFGWWGVYRCVMNSGERAKGKFQQNQLYASDRM